MVILNKVDTMPVFNFDREAFDASVRQLNPQAPIFPIAATKGEASRNGNLAGRADPRHPIAQRTYPIQAGGMSQGMRCLCFRGVSNVARLLQQRG